MKYLLRLCFLFFAFALFSCSKDLDDKLQEQASPCDAWAVVDAAGYAAEEISRSFISRAEISGDCLSITFAASGCNGETWVVKLLDSGTFIETFPPQRNLKLSLKSEELCEALISKEMTFDLRDLQIPGTSELVLNLQGTEEPIVYSY